MRSGGLATRLTLIFLTGVLVIFSIAFFYTYDYSRKILLKEAEQSARMQADLTLSRLETVLGPLEAVPSSLTSILSSESPDPYRILLMTQDIILKNPLVYGSCIAFEPRSNGAADYAHYLFETGSGLGSKRLGGSYNFYAMDWYRLPKEKGSPVWVGPYYDTGGGDTLMCTFSVPFFEKKASKKEFAGVLTLDLSLTALSGMVSSIRPEKGGIAFLISADGRLVTAPSAEYLNKSLSDLVGKDQTLAHATLAKMLQGGTGFLMLNRTWKGEAAWLYYAPVKTTGWSLAIIFPESTLFADLHAFFRRLLFVFLASVLAMAATIIFLSLRLAKPIRQLAIATQKIGNGDFTSSLPEIRSRTEIGELADSFSRMQGALNTYTRSLEEATAARERMEGELRVAHDIQLGLLPSSFPHRSELDLGALLEPAKLIGGDFYDFFFLDDDRLFLAIGDVAGKGIPAALFMSVTRTFFRSKAGSGTTPAQTMNEVNAELCRNNPNQLFVTFLVAILHVGSGLLELCNAGHPLPLLRKKNGLVRPLALKPNIPLGINPEFRFQKDSIILMSGDQVVFYTDGITEAEDPSGRFYTRWSLERSISVADPMTSARLASTVMESLRAFTSGAPPSDDIALMALTFHGRDSERELRLKNELTELNTLKQFLEGLSEEWNLAGEVRNTLNLVLEELFVNIVNYGFDDTGEHHIVIRFKRHPEELVIAVEDDGKPFNILEAVYKGFETTLAEREIGGEGINLVRELMENIEYSRENDRNRVVMRKTIV